MKGSSINWIRFWLNKELFKCWGVLQEETEKNAERVWWVGHLVLSQTRNKLMLSLDQEKILQVATSVCRNQALTLPRRLNVSAIYLNVCVLLFQICFITFHDPVFLGIWIPCFPIPSSNFPLYYSFHMIIPLLSSSNSYKFSIPPPTCTMPL